MLILSMISSVVSGMDIYIYTPHFNIFVIVTLWVTTGRYYICIYIMPFFLRDKHEVFPIHIFMRVYIKPYNETAC